MSPIFHTPRRPILAVCNLFEEKAELKRFALKYGFFGVDWSFELETLPQTPFEESRFVTDISILDPLEIRFHCPFSNMDLGHVDPEQARRVQVLFRRIIRLVSKAGGRFLSIHIGLGRDSTEPLSWEFTVENLAKLVSYGASHGVQVCLENLSWGWTSRPNLFEKLIRRSGAGVTLDIGHAHACEAVQTRQYAVEDFISPHPERIFNAHIYHSEVPGKGHVPPERLEDIEARLRILDRVGCSWWAIEIREVGALLRTKEILEDYFTLTRSEDAAKNAMPVSGATTRRGS